MKNIKGWVKVHGPAIVKTCAVAGIGAVLGGVIGYSLGYEKSAIETENEVIHDIFVAITENGSMQIDDFTGEFGSMVIEEWHR